MARVDPRVLELAERVQALAAERGRADLARALAWRVRTLEAAPGVTLVLAGRTNSGKSSLVNALLGRDIVAEGAHVPTTAPAVVGWAPVEAARVHGPGPSRAVALAEVRAFQHAAADGGAGAEVELYELDIAHPLLAAGVSLVDLPGIGDASGASERALVAERLLAADVLVFVLDAEAPLSRPEAEFLAAVAPAAADVVFVVGKADVALDPEAVVAADRAVLAHAAPQWAEAPVFVLSARELALAERAGDASLAAASGVPALARHVTARLAPHPRVVKSAALARSCRAVVAELEAAERIALAGDLDAGRRAEAAVATHRRYVEGTTAWTADFARGFQRCTRQVVERDLRMRLLECRERREVRIRSGGIALEEVTEHVRADLDELADRMARALVEQVGALMSDWTSRLELEQGVHLPGVTTGAATGVLLPAGDLGGGEWQAREVTHGLAGLVNLARSAASGRSLSSLVGGGLAMGTGVGLVMTGLSWGTSEWLRHKVQDQQGALVFVQAAFTRAQIELESSLREHALELQPVAQAALQRSIDERRGELALVAAEQELEAEREADDADGARAAARRRLDELEPWALRLDGITERLTAFIREGLEYQEQTQYPTGADDDVR